MGYNFKNARNGKSTSKMPKWQCWTPPMRIYESLNKKKSKICMGKVAIFGEQALALQQHFPSSTEFSENSNCRTETYPLMPGASNLAILVFSMRSFHFWYSSSYSP